MSNLTGQRLALLTLLFYGVAFASLLAAPSQTAQGADRRLGNLMKNAGFEHDWVQFNFTDNRRFLLLHTSDKGLGEADGRIDHWKFNGVWQPSMWDISVARSGSRSVRFEAAGSITNAVRLVGETNNAQGGAFYRFFKDMPEELSKKVTRRTIVAGAWYRASEVPEALPPKLTLLVSAGKIEDLGRATAQHEVSATFSAGSHAWEYREVRMEANDIPWPPLFANVVLASQGAGKVWFDDANCEELAAAVEPVNCFPDGGFEAVAPDGWFSAWKKPKLWSWFPNPYYAFTGWSHWKEPVLRGSAEPDFFISHGGNVSLRCNVLPGDSFAVESRTIELNQPEPRPIEIRAWVRADNLRSMEIQGRDQDGHWLDQGDFLGDSVEEPGIYTMATTGAGTYDWTCVRKFLTPRKAIRVLELSIGVRGFDGRLQPNKNIVGTLWIDDVQVLEHGGSGESNNPPPAVAAAPRFPFKVLDLDLGDRLWGNNLLRVRVQFSPAGRSQLAAGKLELSLEHPRGNANKSVAEAAIVREPGDGTPGEAIFEARYRVVELCRDSQQQYKLHITWRPATGEPIVAEQLAFGTPSNLLTTQASGFYFYPQESMTAVANLHVARGAVAELTRLDVVRTKGGKEEALSQVRDFTQLTSPQAAPANIDTLRAVVASLSSDNCTVHPWHEPQLDNRLLFRLYHKSGGKEALLAESAPSPFGFIGEFPKADLPEKIERTAVDKHGFITVNGRPFFPVYWRLHMTTPSPESNYPPSGLGYKSFSVEGILKFRERQTPPDDALKQTLVAAINAVKNDPKLFDYEVGEGEMQLQGPGWTKRLEWYKTAIGWIREADPNHVINGSPSWLIGHPRHDETMQAFIPDWDVIGVESSFESRIRIDTHAKPYMKDRLTSVLVGFEAYFHQSPEIVRWRGYRALLDGANGIGLCPSGMMEARPDRVNYMRGLNGEFRGLTPAILADPPAQLIADDSELVDTWERQLAGGRCLIAVRNEDAGEKSTVKFAFPDGLQAAKVRVLFEGREITATRSGFSDEFVAPKTVHVYEISP